MRGFVTLAVGDEKYYKLAANLLKSYKRSTKKPVPFAIIADRTNKYTKLFDKTVLLREANRSYMDKLTMLKNPPFDENIFIDADCLVYKDINKYWDYFPEKGVTCFGKALPLTSHEGWFDITDIGEYKEKIDFIPQMHGGIIFFKKDELTNTIYRTALSIAKDYKRYRFKYFDNPADEPIIALSMAVNGSKPIELPEEERAKAFLFYPTADSVTMDITSGKLSYTNKKGDVIDNVLLLHWQNVNTETPKYKIEILKLDKKSLFTFSLQALYYYISHYVRCVFLRFWNGIKRRMLRR